MDQALKNQTRQADSMEVDDEDYEDRSRLLWFEPTTLPLPLPNHLAKAVCVSRGFRENRVCTTHTNGTAGFIGYCGIYESVRECGCGA
jgi:hypothetical protein